MATDTSGPHQPRSPLMMNSFDTALIVIDMQEKLLPHISEAKIVTWNIGRLLAGADALGVKVGGTEQYPRGLGETVTEISQPLHRLAGDHRVDEKIMFSCRQCKTLFDGLAADGIRKLLLCGIETHVCVAQTALDMLAAGFDVFLCVDAVGTRHPIDHEIALRRLESSGCTLTTTEAALFEWCETAGAEGFKRISKLVQETLA